ncbi:MAG: universal stress protein [Caulobacteraceae bacterium]|jgi:nucleotide-binding universal stress UspA family protein
MSISTLMAHVEVGRPNAALLDATGRLAERFDAHVIGVAACQPMQLLYGEVYAASELVQLDRDEIERETDAAENEFRAALNGKAKSLAWRCAVTCFPLSELIAGQARAADLLITSPDRGGAPYESTRRTDVGNLVMQAGRPVLILPPDPQPVDFTHALVAWKDTREARRAVIDAVPLLQAAEAVSVVEIAEEADLIDARARAEDVAAWLGRHGVEATAQVEAAHGNGAAQIEAVAGKLGAGLLVAGAYGHTRLREWVFGGVTREILLRPRRCTLVSH